ncbi:MAG TPA: HAMP domain-containing sensor histidine kinase [Polyangiaceae bacterium]
MNNSDALVDGSCALGLRPRPTGQADPGAGSDQAERLEAAVLRERLQQLQARERSRAAWTAQVIHELRRPLTTIDLAAQMLEEAAADDARYVRERLANIRWAIKHMLFLSNDLLDTSAIEAKAFKVVRAPLRIARVVADAIAHLPAVAERCQLQIEPEADVVLCADPRRLEQVLGNLLDNALKYGQPSSKIDVDLARQADHVRVTVSNRGRGISSDRLSRIFEPFERGANARGEEAGLGLGLYIARGIVEAHGGRIWVRSAPAVITQFYFTLPLTTRAAV